MIDLLQIVITIIAILGSMCWMAAPYFAYLLSKYIPRLADHPTKDLQDWPKLSIIIAACNEEETISAALQTLLGQDYPNLEIVIVNDRSTDKTGQIIQEWAQKDPRIIDIHLDHLPEGWLGKVHALHRATEKATGEWLLYTDADVHFHLDVLRKVICLVEQEQIDHLGLIPKITSNSLFAEFCISAALRAISISQKPWHITDPNRDEAMGAKTH